MLFGFYSRVLTGLHGFFQKINWIRFFRLALVFSYVSDLSFQGSGFGIGGGCSGDWISAFIGLASSTITVQICKTLSRHGIYFGQAIF